MKKAQILIDVQPYMCSVALLEDGKLNEFYVEYRENNFITGNIYKGRVMNVLQGMQTAFVNFGQPKNGFLYVGETLDHRSDLLKSGKMPQALSVTEGDYVMVQVTKEEIGSKGARLTQNISLPGRYLVYLPTLDFAAVSNKITDVQTREKLLKLVNKLKDPDGGFIARTVCLDAKKSDIVREAESLKAAYAEIKKSFAAAEGITLVHSEGDLVYRTVRDMLSPNVEQIICNHLPTTESLKGRLKKGNSKFFEKVFFYDSDYDMLDVFNVSAEVDKLLERKVALPSGGSLVIDHTEALTAVDVNTGRFIGSGGHEETVFKTNLEAAEEIARQIRLRNIGGIVVVDFIDMVLEEHQKQVVETLRQATAFDRTKTRVLDMSGLGLVELTRKKSGSELTGMLTEQCPYCKGSAITASNLYVARKIRVALKRLFADNAYTSATVTVNPHLIDGIFGGRFFAEDCENIWKDKRIYIVPGENIKTGAFTVSGSSASVVNVPAGARLLY